MTLDPKSESIRLDIFVPDAVEPKFEHDKMERLNSIAFLDELVKIGLLGELTKKPEIEEGRGITHHYKLLPHPGVSSSTDGWVGNGTLMSVDVGRSEFSGISGIRQEGGQAMVEAIIDQVPTDHFKQIDRIVVEMEKNGKGPRSEPSVIGGTPAVLSRALGRWPTENDIRQKRVGVFYFAMYDDGWRVSCDER
ncbi:MAG TPA: hypothetical protein VFE33_27320 [Thermoanaerobaculia bacterium]|nr:hypothetical protein [Thermoanaerobaculia bacterium]